ncbi:MAG: glycosyltransferase family 4 protein [Mariniphaga sp.]
MNTLMNINQKKVKLLLIFRHAALYRKPIYQKIDNTFDSDFYFSKHPISDLKMLEVSDLKHIVLKLKEHIFPYGCYFLSGMNSISLENYKYIIFAGDIRDISSWILLIKCRILKKKTFLWSHGWYGKEGYFLRLVKKVYFILANNVLIYGNYARSLMIQEGISPSKLHVIYNSLDYDNDLQLRSSLSKSDIYEKLFKYKAPIILFIGRLTTIKKLNLLIEAQKYLILSGIFINVILIGDGVEKENLIYQVNKNDLTSFVNFYGSCYDNSKLAELIYNADLCVSPGNVGLTAIHSLSFGTPVLTHNNLTLQMPEFEVIEKGITGDFFDYNSPISLAFTIKKWIYEHPQKSEELINRCFCRIDKYYNPDEQIEILKKIFV